MLTDDELDDRLAQARRRLHERVPSRDLWADAEARADHDLAPLALADRRRPPLLAAAAILVVLVLGGVAFAATRSGDPELRSGPADAPATGDRSGGDDPSPTPDPAGQQFEASAPCGAVFVRAGEPPLVAGVGPRSKAVVSFDDPEGLAVAHIVDGEQIVELHVPGLVVTDLVGERVEEIVLERGPAQLWLASDFAQVRWFDVDADACRSFTVTAWGSGDEAADRAAAVAAADRVVLPSDAGEAEPPPHGADGSEPTTTGG